MIQSAINRPKPCYLIYRYVQKEHVKKRKERRIVSTVAGKLD